MRIFLISLFSIIAFFSHVPAFAQKAFNSCAEAEHTADILVCLNKRHESVSRQLNSTFEAQENQLSAESVVSFRTVQNEWIKYRDLQCAWEVAQAENESLSRIGELSCMIALAEKRLETLERFSPNMGGGKFEREFIVFPRWMNVVSRAAPDTYWRFGNHLSVDLDCDGQNEEIMPGRKVQRTSKASENKALYDIQAILSVTRNPQMGKPETVIFPLNGPENSAERNLCDPNVNLSLAELPKTADQEAPLCRAAIKIKAKGCEDRIVYWDGTLYTFDPPPDTHSKK